MSRDRLSTHLVVNRISWCQNKEMFVPFCYKAAIGEPLTEICANAISKLGNKTTVSKRK